ncbi:multidrug effflux MFS transporter [Paraburkholderia sp. BCC1886]|uniref:multidrug effflux MFS transporter n=1 Tax=Paraburkholderia sp. BCC1886 TaxID=2562670 RepID=UPI0016432DE9|nr:multidrug effflux MFS transporter [Paraburkholderia sp. BCC1886]
MPQMQPQRAYFMLFLGALAALPPISTDMALPALGSIEDALHTSASAAGLTLSLFMLGFAITPIVLGPMSDRRGRRPCLILGLALFVLGGLGATFAHSIAGLLVARLVQGAGAGSGMTLAFAVVRDKFEGRAAQTRLAAITVVCNVAPIVAPAIGAALLAPVGWRGIYAVMMGCGVVLAVIVTTLFAETLPAAPGKPGRPGEARDARKPVSLPAAYRQILANRTVMANVMINGFGFAWMFSYVAGSPLVLIGEYHVSPAKYAGMFAMTGLGIVVGATLNGKLAQRGVSSRLLLGAAIAIAVGASAILTVSAFITQPALPLTMALLVLCTFSFGLAAPSATHGALEPMPEFAGVAGGLLTSVQMVAGALGSSAVALLFPSYQLAAMTGIMLVTALLAAASLFALPSEAKAH